MYAHTQRDATIASRSGRCQRSTSRPDKKRRGKKTRSKSIVMGMAVQPTKRQIQNTNPEPSAGGRAGAGMFSLFVLMSVLHPFCHLAALRRHGLHVRGSRTMAFLYVAATW